MGSGLLEDEDPPAAVNTGHRWGLRQATDLCVARCDAVNAIAAPITAVMATATTMSAEIGRYRHIPRGAHDQADRQKHDGTQKTAAQRAGLPSDAAGLDSAEVLVDATVEAVEDDEDHEIDIKIDWSGLRITLVISDDGRPFNPLAADPPDTGKPLDDREIGGLGIHLARNLVDDMAYQRQIGRNATNLTGYIG